MRKSVRKVTVLLLAGAMMLTGCSQGSSPSSDKKSEAQQEKKHENKIKQTLRLQYDEPAEFWEENTLPVGNANMGATVFGGIQKETVVLNEKTLWTGGPSESRPNYRGGNVQNSSQYLKQVQEALKSGDKKTVKKQVNKLIGEVDGYGAYQMLGSVNFKFLNINQKTASAYERYLDLNESVAGVKFDCQNVTYTREYFANYPSNVIAMKFAASEAGKLSFVTSMEDTQDGGVIQAEGDTLTYSGALTDNQMRYQGKFQFILKDGTLKPEGDKMSVQGATEAVILFTAATDYANKYPSYRSGIDPAETVEKNLSSAVEKGYDALKKEHQEDYQELFGRVNLDLGEEYTDTCTDDLLKAYQKKTKKKIAYDAKDKYLEVLYYQYGRYLLVSSSREGTLPANLQGVWNNSNSPVWSSDYHINVNLQMNYWPAMVTNLAETATSLVDYVDSLREPGRITAADYYGIVSDEKNPENGWVAHTQSTPFGWTCPGYEFTWGWSSAATAWLDLNLWEYYLFTGDKKYLEEKIYPVLRESAKFYSQFLIYDEKQGRFVSSPTYSPEHGPVTIGNTYEQSLIRMLLVNFMDASEMLKKDEDLRETVGKMAEKMEPYQVSSKTGMLKEWYEEDDAGFDSSDVEKQHRHTSHLLGLYPGNDINYDTVDLMEAAKASLNDRGDEGTGWGMAMKVCLWARTGDGNHSYQVFNHLLSERTNPNLWDVHPPFQIDGNFGGTAGVSEMLLQSHMDYIQLIPSLPDAWSEGSFDGLCARGGFEISATWKDKNVTEAGIVSNNGGICRMKAENCKVKTADGKEVKTKVSEDGIVEFDTEKNETYILSFAE